MPSNVPLMPPQLPPYSPQPSLVPGVSLSSSSSKSLHPTPKWSDSTLPPRRLPDPHEVNSIASSHSTTRARAVQTPPSSSPSPYARHKHSRSHSRTAAPLPLAVVPSASSPGSIIKPSTSSHVRSASASLLKKSTSRPHPAGNDGVLRPLPKVPPPPPQLSLESVSSREQYLPLPPPRRRIPTPTPESPAADPTPLTPPPRPKLQLGRPEPAAFTPERTRAPSAALPELPHSAPVSKTEREKVREMRNGLNAVGRPGFVMSNPEHPLIDSHMHYPASAPAVPVVSPPRNVGQPILPKPPSATLPSHPRLMLRTNQLTTGAKTRREDGASMPAARQAAGPVRKRMAKLSVAMRTTVGTGAAPRSPRSPRSPKTDGLARKWVVERRGKRTTVKPQDAMVVAERLRMLR